MQQLYILWLSPPRCSSVADVNIISNETLACANNAFNATSSILRLTMNPQSHRCEETQRNYTVVKRIFSFLSYIFTVNIRHLLYCSLFAYLNLSRGVCSVEQNDASAIFVYYV